MLLEIQILSENGQASTLVANELSELLESHGLDTDHKIKLIIHAGTPKTGTTSLQTYLDKRQRKLRGKGILYPHNLEKINNSHAPKHQWFEKNLTTAHSVFFLENVKNIISQVQENTHTIILSSEGIYNYWWDFPEESKAMLSELSKLFDVEVWVWFREPIEFIESYYKQCIRNPRIESNPCYGKDLSISQMLDMQWFSQHLDYQGFVSDCRRVFGANTVKVFEYKDDIVQEVMQRLGLDTPHDNPTQRLNKSLHSPSIEILRTINQYDLSAKDKNALMPHLKAMNDVLESYKDQSILDDDARNKVMKYFKPIVQ